MDKDNVWNIGGSKNNILLQDEDNNNLLDPNNSRSQNKNLKNNLSNQESDNLTRLEKFEK